MGVIALLSVMTLIAFETVRKNSRDSQRKADLARIRTALEIYFTRFGKYPDENMGGDPPVNADCDSSMGTKYPSPGQDCTPSGNGLVYNWFVANGENPRNTDLYVLLSENILSALPIDPLNKISGGREYFYMYEPDKVGEGSPACGGSGNAACRFVLQTLLENGLIATGGRGLCIYTLIGGQPGKPGFSNDFIDLETNDCTEYLRPNSWTTSPAVPCCKI